MSGLRDGEVETATAMAAALRAGEVRSVELVARAVARAEAWEPVINAFSQLWPRQAMDEALRIEPGDPRPFAGVPIAVKDLFDVAGRETTGCSLLYAGNVAAADAAIVARVRAAGMIILGKTNQHELAAGGTNEVSSCGPARNPWDPSRITGGSSGGSAAVVAAGVVPWALGSDTGGSIRIPASMCGTFGLKPTTGLLPARGMLPLAPSLDCPGPMAATASDLRALFEVMAGRPGPPDRALDSPLRVAVIARGYHGGPVHPEIHDAVEKVASASAHAYPVSGDGIEDARWVWIRICCPEFAEAHPRIFERPDLVAPSVLAWAEQGRTLPAREAARAARRGTDIAAWFRSRLEGADVLVVPTTVYPAFPLGAEEADLGAAGTVSVHHVGPGRLTSAVNLSGLPAVNVPAGRSSTGLPIGVTIVGRDEAILLAAAARWEASRPPVERPALDRGGRT